MAAKFYALDYQAENFKAVACPMLIQIFTEPDMMSFVHADMHVSRCEVFGKRRKNASGGTDMTSGGQPQSESGPQGGEGNV